MYNRGTSAIPEENDENAEKKEETDQNEKTEEKEEEKPKETVSVTYTSIKNLTCMSDCKHLVVHNYCVMSHTFNN